MSEEKPKIIIDEDWKSQVQREKEEAAKAAQEQQAGGGDAAAQSEAGTERLLTPFEALLQSLAAQAMYALGLIAADESGRVAVNIAQAKWVLDILEALREKTTGNLSPEEEGMLTEILAELQQAYTVRAQQVQEAMLKQSGIDPANLKPQV